MEKLRFDGQVAVVTGAGRGVGAAHARLLAARGAAVVVNDIGFTDAEGGDHSGVPASEVVRAITAAGGRAVANAEDVSTRDGARRLVEQALDTFGGLMTRRASSSPVPPSNTAGRIVQTSRSSPRVLSNSMDSCKSVNRRSRAPSAASPCR